MGKVDPEPQRHYAVHAEAEIRTGFYRKRRSTQPICSTKLMWRCVVSGKSSQGEP